MQDTLQMAERVRREVELTILSSPLASCRLAAKASAPTLYPFDHIHHANPTNSTLPPAVVYFHPSSELFPPLLKLVASFRDLPLVVRYRSDPAAETGAGVRPGGWGVEMVLKKMEYSSVDDRTSADSADES